MSRAARALRFALLLSLSIAGCGQVGRSGPGVGSALEPSSVAPTSAPANNIANEIAAPRQQVPIRSVSSLSVMSFNLRYGTSPDGDNHWDQRASVVFDILRERRPDVVALQEDALFQLEQVLHAVAGYAAIGTGSSGGTEGEHVAILYRMDRLQVEDRGVFWISDRPLTPGSRGFGAGHARICTWALLRDRDNDQPVLFYNTHLDHRSAESRTQGFSMMARHIREQAEGRPVIVAGDFNLVPEDEALQRFLTEASLTDTYRQVHPEPSDEEGTYHAFRGDRSGPRVDFILVSSHARVGDADILRTESEGRWPSDHYPISATIQLSRAD